MLATYSMTSLDENYGFLVGSDPSQDYLYKQLIRDYKLFTLSYSRYMQMACILITRIEWLAFLHELRIKIDVM